MGKLLKIHIFTFLIFALCACATVTYEGVAKLSKFPPGINRQFCLDRVDEGDYVLPRTEVIKIFEQNNLKLDETCTPKNKGRKIDVVISQNYDRKKFNGFQGWQQAAAFVTLFTTPLQVARFYQVSVKIDGDQIDSSYECDMYYSWLLSPSLLWNKMCSHRFGEWVDDSVKRLQKSE